jgi:hypothetical protein
MLKSAGSGSLWQLLHYVYYIVNKQSFKVASEFTSILASIYELRKEVTAVIVVAFIAHHTPTVTFVLTLHGLTLNFMPTSTCHSETSSMYHQYFNSKTNQMHNMSNLFYFGTTLYMFRTVSPSTIRSLRLYIEQQVYVIQVLWLLPSCFHLAPAS